MTSVHNAKNGHSNNFKPAPDGRKPWENIDLEKADTTQFNFDGALIRMIVICGVPWFLAADVCRALQIAHSKGSYASALRKLCDHEKRQINRAQFFSKHPSNFDRVDVDGNSPIVWLISESGLYFLAMRSQGATKEGTVAFRFRVWITEEVLPAIRATGSYGPKALPSDPLATQFTEPGRYVVLVSPNKPPHVRLTSYDVSLDALALINAELLLNRIRTILCLWERAKLLRSTGIDPFETKVPGQLSTAIIDCRDLAEENAEMLIFPKKDVPDIPPD